MSILPTAAQQFASTNIGTLPTTSAFSSVPSTRQRRHTDAPFPSNSFFAPPAASLPASDPFNPFNVAVNPFDDDGFPAPEDTPHHRTTSTGSSFRHSEDLAFDPFSLDAFSLPVPLEEFPPPSSQDNPFGQIQHDVTVEQHTHEQPDEEAFEEAYEEEEEETERMTSRESEDEDHVHDLTALEVRDQFVRGDTYVITYPKRVKLGLLLERKDEWVSGLASRAERAVVRMVIADTESDVRGVSVGSKVVAVNGESVVGRTYEDILQIIRGASRPLAIEFERAPLQTHGDEVSVSSDVLLYTCIYGNICEYM